MSFLICGFVVTILLELAEGELAYGTSPVHPCFYDVQNECCPPEGSDCPQFECTGQYNENCEVGCAPKLPQMFDEETFREFKKNPCGSNSLYSCGAADHCEVFANITGSLSFSNSVFDGSTARSFVLNSVATLKEAFQFCTDLCHGNTECFNTCIDSTETFESLFDMSIVTSTENQECIINCQYACEDFMDFCTAPKKELTCNFFTNGQGCQESVFWNENSHENHIECIRGEKVPFPNLFGGGGGRECFLPSNIGDGRDSVCSRSFFENSNSNNEVIIKNGASRTTFYNTYSHNDFHVEGASLLYSYVDNSYSYNNFLCTIYEEKGCNPDLTGDLQEDSACSGSYFNNKYSENFFRCDGKKSCSGDIEIDGDDDSSACLFDNRYSWNEFGCTGEDSCRECNFLNDYSNNHFSCEDKEACEESNFFNSHSQNVFSCKKGNKCDNDDDECEVCNEAKFYNEHSYNEFYCIGEDANADEVCEDSMFINNYSKNYFNCTSACEDTYFENRNSQNYFFCDDIACGFEYDVFPEGDTTRFENSYSENYFVCSEGSCSGSIHINRNSPWSEYTCGEDSCDDSLMDFTDAGYAKIVCHEESACDRLTVYAENTEFLEIFLSDEEDGDGIGRSSFVCYDSHCSLSCDKASCGDISTESGDIRPVQLTCGGIHGSCIAQLAPENVLIYHCYDGASCTFVCQDECGVDDENTMKSFINCESAKSCDIDCSGKSCSNLDVSVKASPFRIYPMIQHDSSCTVSNGHNDVSCSELQYACGPDMYLCNPGEYIYDPYTIECQPSPQECSGATCQLSYLAVGGTNIYLTSKEYYYTVYVDPYAQMVHVSASAVDYYATITVGTEQSTAVINTNVKLGGGKQTDIEISVCSQKLSTCIYYIKVIRGYVLKPYGDIHTSHEQNYGEDYEKSYTESEYLPQNPTSNSYIKSHTSTYKPKAEHMFEKRGSKPSYSTQKSHTYLAPESNLNGYSNAHSESHESGNKHKEYDSSYSQHIKSKPHAVPQYNSNSYGGNMNTENSYKVHRGKEYEKTYGSYEQHSTEACPCIFGKNECCPSDFFSSSDFQCPAFECFGYNCELECTDTSNNCGSYSLYSCGSGVNSCEIYARNDSFQFSVIDGVNSETLRIEIVALQENDDGSDTDPSQRNFYGSIIRSKFAKEKCVYDCEAGGCGHMMGFCRAPERRILCGGKIENIDEIYDASCIESVFSNTYSVNHIWCHNFEIDDFEVTPATCTGSFFDNSYSVNSIRFTREEDDVDDDVGDNYMTLINRHSHNDIEVISGGFLITSRIDNSHSKNDIRCNSDNSCSGSFFTNVHSKNNVRCSSVNTCSGEDKDDSSGDDAACIFDNRYSENTFRFEELEAGRRCLFHNEHSKSNYFYCNEGQRVCEDSVFINSYSGENRFRFESRGAGKESFFDNSYSQLNVFKCDVDYDEDTDVGSSSCRESVFINSHSHNVFECRGDNVCDQSFFDNRYSKNEFTCIENACDTSSRFDNRYSENHFVCNDACKNEAIFINRHAISNRFECSNDACDDSLFDFSYSGKSVVSCEKSSCFESSFYAEHTEFLKIDFLTKDDQINRPNIFCKNSRCEIFCQRNACGEFNDLTDISGGELKESEPVQLTCGGSESKCRAVLRNENYFNYHCYDGAQCNLICEEGKCGRNSDAFTFLNCETAGFCNVECGYDGDCDNLKISLGNAPIRIKSFVHADCEVTSTTARATTECEDLQMACYDPELFLCNPSEYMDGAYPECSPDPLQCTGSNCKLESLSVAGSLVDLHYSQRSFEVSVDHYNKYVDVYAVALDYYSTITIGYTVYQGEISTSVPLSETSPYTHIEIYVCSPEKTTCKYYIRVHKVGGSLYKSEYTTDHGEKYTSGDYQENRYLEGNASEKHPPSKYKVADASKYANENKAEHKERK